MKKIVITALAAALMILQPVICFGEDKEAEPQKASVEEVHQFLNKFVGKWQFEEKYNDQDVVSTVEFKWVLGDKFIKGDMVSRSKDDNEVLVKKTIYFNFNLSASTILFFSLASDGWIYQYMGNFREDSFRLQGVTPKGMDFFQWKFKSEDELERSYFEPSTKFPDWEKPDQVIVFKKLK